MKRVSILTTMLILTACAAAVDSPTPSPNPTATTTLTPSATATHVQTAPSPTLTPKPTKIPPMVTAYSEDDYFFANLDTDCEPPCWSGLQIGASNPGDFEEVISEFFANQSNQVTPRGSVLDFYGLPQEGYYTAGYQLSFPDGLFEINIVVADNTNSIDAVIFSNYDPLQNGSYPFHTPQEVLRRLGEPAGIYTQFLETAPTAPVYALGRIFMAYEQGITFFTVHHLEPNDPPVFCLDHPTTNEYIFLFEAFSDDLSGLGELQDSILWLAQGGNSSLPSEVSFQKTPAEITYLAQTEENACLEIK